MPCLFEACREFGEFVFGEVAAGLPGVRFYMFNGNDAVGSSVRGLYRRRAVL